MGSSYPESLPSDWRTVCTKGHGQDHTRKCLNWISPQGRKYRDWPEVQAYFQLQNFEEDIPGVECRAENARKYLAEHQENVTLEETEENIKQGNAKSGSGLGKRKKKLDSVQNENIDGNDIKEEDAPKPRKRGRKKKEEVDKDYLPGDESKKTKPKTKKTPTKKKVESKTPNLPTPGAKESTLDESSDISENKDQTKSELKPNIPQDSKAVNSNGGQDVTDPPSPAVSTPLPKEIQVSQVSNTKASQLSSPSPATGEKNKANSSPQPQPQPQPKGGAKPFASAKPATPVRHQPTSQLNSQIRQTTSTKSQIQQTPSSISKPPQTPSSISQIQPTQSIISQIRQTQPNVSKVRQPVSSQMRQTPPRLARSEVRGGAPLQVKSAGPRAASSTPRAPLRGPVPRSAAAATPPSRLSGARPNSPAVRPQSRPQTPGRETRYTEVPVSLRSFMKFPSRLQVNTGGGSSLYKAAVQHCELSPELWEELRQHCHTKMGDWWQWYQPYYTFPLQVRIKREAGQLTLRSVSSPENFLKFLRTEESLHCLYQSECELYCLANILGISIHILTFTGQGKQAKWQTFDPHQGLVHDNKFARKNKEPFYCLHEVKLRFNRIVKLK